MSRRSRSLNLLEPHEPSQACSGIPLPLTLHVIKLVHECSKWKIVREAGHRKEIKAQTHAELVTWLRCFVFEGLMWPNIKFTVFVPLLDRTWQKTQQYMTRYPLYRRLGGPQGRSGRVRKISRPLGFDARTVQPLASLHTDCAIPVHKYYVCVLLT
jgi:hypothetical protein